MLKLTAFTLRSLNDLSTVITIAKRAGVTDINDLEKLLQSEIHSRLPKKRSISETRTRTYENNKLQDQASKDKNSVKCSLCGFTARPLTVNDTPGTQVGGDYQSCAVCMNRDCRNVDYYKDTVHDLIARNT